MSPRRRSSRTAPSGNRSSGGGSARVHYGQTVRDGGGGGGGGRWGAGGEEIYIGADAEVTLFTARARGNSSITAETAAEDGASGAVMVRPTDTGRPALLVSSTSWTPDEDFGILLEALRVYDAAAVADTSAAGGSMGGDGSSGGFSLDGGRQLNASQPFGANGMSRRRYPDLVVVVTGTGPQRLAYEVEMRDLRLSHVAVRTAWLTAEDYPTLLGAADLGVCLHVSSSGLDLPMKVVDMLGAGLPVAAARYDVIHELIREDKPTDTPKHTSTDYATDTQTDNHTDNPTDVATETATVKDTARPARPMKSPSGKQKTRALSDIYAAAAANIGSPSSVRPSDPGGVAHGREEAGRGQSTNRSGCEEEPAPNGNGVLFSGPEELARHLLALLDGWFDDSGSGSEVRASAGVGAGAASHWSADASSARSSQSLGARAGAYGLGRELGLDRLRRGAAAAGAERWADNWERCAKPLFQ